jgi:hypothetical protein
MSVIDTLVLVDDDAIRDAMELLLICGANIDIETFAAQIGAAQARNGRR